MTRTHVTPPSRSADGQPPDPEVERATIWHGVPDLTLAGALSADCVIGNLGIELTALGNDYVTGRMPVDSRTRQPLGLLHGGASVLLAETLVSFAATFVVGPGEACVGIEINARVPLSLHRSCARRAVRWPVRAPPRRDLVRPRMGTVAVANI